MIHVAALTSGASVPSSRFRVRQHVAALRRAGIEIREFAPLIDKFAPLPGADYFRDHPLVRKPIQAAWAALKLAARAEGLVQSWRASVTWLERELFSGFRTLEPLLRRPYVFDVDDAIWAFRPGATADVARIASDAATVIAGNRYLADWFRQHSRDVRIIPTAVDTERFAPGPAADHPFTIGWTGVSGNLVYLYGIERALNDFLRRRGGRLVVVADKPPRFHLLPPERVLYRKWSPETEASALRDFDVGVMPLADDPITRGKCSFKMLQYMACGLPVVVSPVGMNAEVLSRGELGLAATTLDEWSHALDLLYRDPDLRRTMGGHGRAVVEAHFSREVVSAQLAAVFQEFS